MRNKQKQETDFLVVRDRSPWLLVEAKTRDEPIAKHHIDTMKALENVPLAQVCLEPGVAVMQRPGAYRISAGKFFG